MAARATMDPVEAAATANGRAERYDDDGVAKVRFIAGLGAAAAAADSDPVLTEVIRHGLNSAADQMRRVLMRTAYSAAIYEMADFAVAIYDRQVRMLAQSPSLPIFMGNLSFSVEAAIAAVGGEDGFDPGDIVLQNVPYSLGGHPQDGCFVMPIFLPESELIGYAAVRAHLMDLGAKEPYCTDTTDVFQEGAQFPGVKLFRRGERNDEIWRIFLANTRVPTSVGGDVNAMIGCLRIGSDGLIRVVQKYGLEPFRRAVERIYDHGEATVREYFERLPDGHYLGQGVMDGDGVVDEEVPFTVAIDIEGSDIRVDYSMTPDARGGPMNSCFPTTVSATRIAISMLAGAKESPNEGTYRPIEIISRPGSMFHPLPPAPCFLTDYLGGQAVEVIYQAISQALPDAVPACSSGDVNVTIWWGESGAGEEPWAEASIHAIGMGGDSGGDGNNAMFHVVASSMRLVPTEVYEARHPWVVERSELEEDSCGPGRHRGGLGQILSVRLLSDGFLTAPSERMRTAPWGLDGGGEGIPNTRVVHYPDGRSETFEKVTALALPAGSIIEQRGGGGGGFGSPADRDPEAVRDDLREGYISEAHARRHYPHAFERLAAEVEA